MVMVCAAAIAGIRFRRTGSDVEPDHLQGFGGISEDLFLFFFGRDGKHDEIVFRHDETVTLIQRDLFLRQDLFQSGV